MSNVLENIVANKRSEVSARMESLPLSTVTANLTPSDKSLFSALNAADTGYIFECKKASPSRGLIRDPFDLEEILAAYTPYAAAISVLTDEKYFQGSYENLAYVTERASQPVLNKDFFISEYQVYLARYYKADAILLMLSVLDDEAYKRLAAVAHQLQLDVLTEVSNAEEMHRAIALKAKIIGINNRDLRDLSTDLATTEKLVPMLKEATHQYVVVSESGIYSHQDVRRLAPHCHGFLVGSALMAQPDLPQAVRALVYGIVKVCGLTNANDARQAFDAGACFGGLIFAAKSARCISLAQARDIVSQVPGAFVGVFVNQPVEEVAGYARELALKAVQLHGEEDSGYRETLRQALPEGCEIWQAVGVEDVLKAAAHELLKDKTVDRVLLDRMVGSAKGGTGRKFDWSLLQTIDDKSRLVLAGGIGPDSVSDALATGVGMVDVNSGVENSPGQKSADKLNLLFSRCRQY